MIEKIIGYQTLSSEQLHVINELKQLEISAKKAAKNLFDTKLNGSKEPVPKCDYRYQHGLHLIEDAFMSLVRAVSRPQDE